MNMIILFIVLFFAACCCMYALSGVSNMIDFNGKKQ